MQLAEITYVPELPNDVIQDATYEIAANKALVVGNSHRFFNKYPAKYIPHIPRWAISKYLGPEDDGILDPFCGSGTTLVEGMLQGKNGYGIDVDPFARLLTKVKTRPFSSVELRTLDRTVLAIRNRIEQSVPITIELPPIPDITKWFREDIIDKLIKIKQLIIAETGGEGVIFDYLSIVLAGIIRKVSNAENGSPKPYISTRFPKDPQDPYLYFFKIQELYREALGQFSHEIFNQTNFGLQRVVPDIKLVGTDARDFVLDKKIKLAVTSPPYINAFDYVRSLKFENLWLGLADPDDLLEIRRQHVGTESLGERGRNDNLTEVFNIPSLDSAIYELRESDSKRASIVTAFFEDMRKNLGRVYNALDDNGTYVIVIGDSLIRGVEIPTADILASMGNEFGFKLELKFQYVIRDRYLHIPRGGKGGLIKLDRIIVLRK
ncbi:DNA methyltransferase [Paenibacillus donghaensis]|uniref:DNA methyltransferase n=1 Tax=Paenibacillus donghaensis TaxID=414771 RepID=UPI001471A88D|nr:DNA methyltransferase [Paenibacillus donghaensis]